MSPRVEKWFLVVSASGDVRVNRKPRLRHDEVSIALNIRFPDGWGTQVGSIDVTLPDVPVVEGEVE